jgi:hypothetical protein
MMQKEMVLFSWFPLKWHSIVPVFPGFAPSLPSLLLKPLLALALDNGKVPAVPTGTVNGYFMDIPIHPMFPPEIALVLISVFETATFSPATLALFLVAPAIIFLSPRDGADVDFIDRFFEFFDERECRESMGIQELFGRKHKRPLIPPLEALEINVER